MKELHTYITEKLSIDDMVPDNDFPIDGPIKDIVRFLEYDDFENFDDYDLDLNYFGEYEDFFNKKHKKLFVYNIKSRWVRFADTSMKKISVENPIIVVKFNEDGDEKKPTYAVEIDSFWDRYLNKEEFKKAIKKVFKF